MITEQQQELAALCALGALDSAEQLRFAAEVRVNRELRQLLHSLQQVLDKVALAAASISLIQPSLQGLQTNFVLWCMVGDSQCFISP